MKWQKLLFCLVIIFLLASMTGCTAAGNSGDQQPQPGNETGTAVVQVEKGQSYSTKDEVAAYIHEFHSLPSNFITKEEARDAGWDVIIEPENIIENLGSYGELLLNVFNQVAEENIFIQVDIEWLDNSPML